MTHNTKAVMVSRTAHIVTLSAMMLLTWAFIISVL
jgi:hypothetical protein